jgi:hypothetical protein
MTSRFDRRDHSRYCRYPVRLRLPGWTTARLDAEPVRWSPYAPAHICVQER